MSAAHVGLAGGTPAATVARISSAQPCDGLLSILYLGRAFSARELGGHYANDNCCSKKENGSGGP